MRKSKTVLFIIYILFLSSTAFSQYYNNSEKGNLGLGVQLSYPFYGVSAQLNFIDRIGIQGIFGLNSDIKSYSGKLSYNVIHNYNYNFYVYGVYGRYEYTDWAITGFFLLEEITEKENGYGFGFGVDTNYLSNKALVPVWANFEVGYGYVDFQYLNFDTPAITIGVGLHYYFDFSNSSNF